MDSHVGSIGTRTLSEGSSKKSAFSVSVRSIQRWFRVLIVLLVSIFGGTNIFSAQSPQKIKLTIPQAVRMALNQNPGIHASNLTESLAHETEKQAAAALLPKTELVAGDTVKRINIQTSIGILPALLGSEHEGPYQIAAGGVSFNAPIVDLASVEQYRAAKHDTAASVASVSVAREQIVNRVVSQYLIALRAVAEVKAVQSRVELAEALFKQAKDMEDNGTGTHLDSLRASQLLKVEQQNLIIAQTQQKTALFVLIYLLNIPSDSEIELEDETALYDRSMPSSENTLLDEAFLQRPEIKQVRERLAAAHLEIDANRSKRLPTIEASGTWYEEGSRANTVIPTYKYSLGIEVPLFTGGRIRSEIASSVLRQRQITQDEIELRNRVALEVKTAFETLHSALDEVEVAESGLSLAREEVTESEDRFMSGVSNNIEVVTAQDALAKANDNQIAALYRVSIARTELAHAIGKSEVDYAK